MRIQLHPDNCLPSTQHCISGPHAWAVWPHSDNAQRLLATESVFRSKGHYWLYEEISKLSDNLCQLSGIQTPGTLPDGQTGLKMIWNGCECQNCPTLAFGLSPPKQDYKIHKIHEYSVTDFTFCTSCCEVKTPKTLVR